MNTYIVLLRGVNVGGKNVLPMKGLKVVLESNGFKNVKTYIQSGNIVLQSSMKPDSAISTLIRTEYGFSPIVLSLSKNEFDRSITSNPYREYEGKFVHFYYCRDEPKLNSLKLAKSISETESYKLVGNVFYLHAPDGIGRSKLVANIDACLGVAATGRNLNTVNKLIELVKDA